MVTEYGVADLRGLSDQGRHRCVAQYRDSRFQDGLKLQAQAAGKLPKDYEIPQSFRNNTPPALDERFILARARGLFSEVSPSAPTLLLRRSCWRRRSRI